jgi:uncharacterized protein DUF6093
VSLETARAYFAQRQADLFRSTVTIKVKTGETFNPSTGANTPVYTTRASGVSCLIRPRSAHAEQVGEEEAIVARHEAKFPVDQVVEIDDLIVVTGSTHDAGLVGKTFAVKERLHDDWQICRRVLLEVAE